MQADGNLVAFDSANEAFWASNSMGTDRRTPVTAFVQDDGNLVVYDATCTSLWTTNTLRTAKVAAPCSANGTRQRVPLPPGPQVTGPFAFGDKTATAFDDASFANNGANKISKIEVRASAGWWIGAVRFTYGTTAAPWRGNSATANPALTLAANEWITQAWVRSYYYVNEIRFFTSRGRYWSTSGDTKQSGDMGTLASPCPAGAYRRASTGQPQCMSRDGRTCVTSPDGYMLRMCADTLSTKPVTCSTKDGADDHLHWCTKARGALGLPQAPVPIRIAFFNVEICNSGLAVTNKDDITKIIYTDPDSLKNFWRQSSNSRAFMDESTSTVVDLRLPCDKFPIDSCNLTSWIEYVRDNTAALGGRNYSQEFQYQSFIAPKTPACDAKQYVGYAYYNSTWIRNDGARGVFIFKHEIGHNFGFGHSGRIIPPAEEQLYGDFSSPMGGYCQACLYNAVHQLQLGWSRALPVVDWAIFTGSTVVTLLALSDVAAFTELGVVQIRLAVPSDPGVPGGVTSEIYLSYRVTKNQDATLPEECSEATSVHAYDGNTWFLAWPKAGQAYVNTANKMVVRQDFGDANQARVTLCKWVRAQNECGEFTTFERSRVAVAPQGAPADFEAYFGKHTLEPRGRPAHPHPASVHAAG
ncbi:hypothetical protein OEZ86_007387 [Tetradesmus obliquus]|nr:hypothetical protein OEZ86_007387 [Tetradesmus obliquus]